MDGIVSRRPATVCRSQLPDFVIRTKVDQNFPVRINFEGVVLFSDVSGFTQLCQTYAGNHEYNASDLAAEFNDYLKPVTEMVLAAGGDIYKFAGDAILAHWPVNPKDDSAKSHSIDLAINCAVTLKERYCKFRTHVGTTLNIKSAICYGPYSLFLMSGKLGGKTDYFNDLGNKSDSSTVSNFYVCYGDAIKCSSECEHQCGPEDVVMSMATWQLCENKNQYIVEERIFPHNPVKTLILVQGRMDRGVGNEMVRIGNRFRPLINFDFPEKERNYHRMFLIAPVVRKIMQDEPLEYLSELRMISIVFINVEIRHQDERMARELQQMLGTVLERIHITKGVLTKLLMFDKGLSFLCAFGLSGYRHADDSERALRFGLLAVSALKQNSYVISCSAGVCTGLTFCGIVGHPDRCEYTVIGRKVNMAARLMMAYPGLVSCDTDTFYKSRLEPHCFNELETVELKGLTNVGVIRAYLGSAQGAIGNDLKTHAAGRYNPFPIIDCETEIKAFFKIVNAKLEDKAKTYDVIVISGECGSGKTRLIQHLLELFGSYERHHALRISAVSASLENSYSRYWTLKEVLRCLLKINWTTIRSRMALVASLLHDRFAYPHLVNILVDTDFPGVPVPSHVDSVRETDLMVTRIMEALCSHAGELKITDNLLDGFLPLPTFLIIDDVQHVDQISLKFLLDIASLSAVTVVFSLTGSIYETDIKMLGSLANSDRVTSINVTKLPARFEATLACQLLSTGHIATKVLTVLHDRANGLPASMISILSDMLINGSIRIEDLPDDSAGSQGDLNDDKKIESALQEYMGMRELTKDGVLRKAREQAHMNKLINVVKGQEALLYSHIDAAHHSVHIAYDHLPDLAQRITKIGSLIGHKFQTNAILHVLQSEDHAGFPTALMNLFTSNFLMCAQIKSSSLRQRIKENRNMNTLCYCPSNPNGQVTKCSYLKFYKLADRETSYSYIVKEFKIKTCRKLVRFYEHLNHRCRKNCQGDAFDIDFKIDDLDNSSAAVNHRKDLQFVSFLQRMKSEDWVRKIERINHDHIKRKLKQLRSTLQHEFVTESIETVTVKTKHASLDELEILETTMYCIDDEIGKCCRPEGKRQSIVITLQKGMPYVPHRLDFKRHEFGSIIDMNIHQALAEKQSSTPYDCESCQCTRKTIKAYLTILKLCEEGQMHEKHIYYSLQYAMANILTNSAYEAKEFLRNVDKLLPETDKASKAIIAYMRALVAQKMDDPRLVLMQTDQALDYLDVDLDVLSKWQQLIATGAPLVEEQEQSNVLVALILIKSSEANLEVKEFELAYWQALLALQILPHNALQRLDAIAACIDCCCRMNSTFSCDMYFDLADPFIKRVLQISGHEPLVIRIYWYKIKFMLMKGRLTEAITAGHSLLTILERINAPEKSLAPVICHIFIAAMLLNKLAILRTMLSKLADNRSWIWFSLLSVDMLNTCDESNKLIDLRTTWKQFHEYIFQFMQESVGKKDSSTAGSLYVYMSAVLMELYAKRNLTEEADEHFKFGIGDLLMRTEWSFVDLYSFSKLCLFQYKHRDLKADIPPLVHAYQSVCKQAQLFHAVFAICLSYNDMRMNKIQAALRTAKQGLTAAQYLTMPTITKICTDALDAIEKQVQKMNGRRSAYT